MEAPYTPAPAVDKSGIEQFTYLKVRPESLHGNVLELGSGQTEKLKDTPGLPSDCKVFSMSRDIFTGHDPSIGHLRKKETWDKRTTEADMLELPFADNTFQTVISVDCFPELVGYRGEDIRFDVRRGYREIVRVLDSGGTALLFPVQEHDLRSAKEALGESADVEIQLVSNAHLKKYDYRFRNVSRMIIRKR